MVDFWADEDLGVHEVSFRTDVAAHGARQLVLLDVDCLRDWMCWGWKTE